MTEEVFFHFTLGPVQTFVAQARRTRDFWAGSFLLSTLAAVAMRETEEQGGEIAFPLPNADFMAALVGTPNATLPQQGLVPNRFKARVPAGFDGDAVSRAVRIAWVAISDLAWKRLPSDLRDWHPKMSAIWSRQIGIDLASGEPDGSDPLWEMAWALGSTRDGEDLLDRRKNLRCGTPPAEPGMKCMLMDGWQELSGAERPGQRKESEAFWEALRRHVNRHNRSDLREDEQLCAIAIVKRLFPHAFQQLRCPMPSGWTLHGWKLETGVPSTAYLSAAPWLADLLEAIDPAAAGRFRKAALKVGQAGESRTHLPLVREAAPSQSDVARLADLDGDLFFETSLANPREFPDQQKAFQLRSLLAGLRALPHPAPKSPGEKLGDPDPYFAVLAMDGDRLGSNMAVPDKQQDISEALALFAEEVPSIVHKESGFLVYAGGDDVIALLPVPQALPCALALRRHYTECFAETTVASTLSGAVHFANHKLPLTHNLRNAHLLLDEVAKDARGRDAIAVQVTSRGGELIRWAQPWDVALDGHDLVLAKLAEMMAEEEAPFSHRFFHRIDALLRLVNPDPDRSQRAFDDATAIELFTGELLSSSRYPVDARNGEGTSRVEKARGHVASLLHQCRPQPRRLDGSLDRGCPIEADGAFLVRFLSRRLRRRR